MMLIVAFATARTAIAMNVLTRRTALAGLRDVSASAAWPATAAEPPIETTASGLMIQDFRVGTGAVPRRGQRVTMDVVMQTSGARYGSKIYSTKDSDEPVSFTLGDDRDVIAGLQEAVSTMRAGGIRRVFIPAPLGYVRGEQNKPIPPTFAEYQRWKNLYANPNRPYQPELVLDIKLFKLKD